MPAGRGNLILRGLKNLFELSKAFNEVILQNICSWGYGLLKNRMFLQNLEKALLENLICSYDISFSWKNFVSPEKFVCVLVPFLILLENLMCSYKRIMSSPGKFEVFLLHSSLWKI